MEKKTYGADADLDEHRRVRPVAFCTSTAFRALAILRAVRCSGKENLGLREAIAIALEQGAAFKRWCELGTPIRRVQVWVESHLVMTVSPEEHSVKLKAFSFAVPSPSDAVMRILKADEGEQPIVLRNLPLKTVPIGGLDETSELPNGQWIRLVIRPEEIGRYDIKVAFAPKEDAASLREIDRPQAAAATAKSAGARNTSSNHRGYIPTLLPQPRFTSGAWACAFVILLAVNFGWVAGFAPGSDNQKFADAPRDVVAENLSLSVKPSASFTQQPNQIDNVVGPKAQVSVILPRSPLIVADSKDATCPISRNGADAKEKQSWDSSGAMEITPQHAPLQTVRQEAVAESIVASEVEATSPPEVFTSWDAQSLAKLASVRIVYVKIDDTSPAEVSELDALHTSFVRVLKNSSEWQVADDSSSGTKPDAVLKLRFEPDKTCLGVVLIEIRDAENNRLWRAYVSCQDLEKQGHEAMFADASTRLIDKLQDTLKLSQSSARRADVDIPEANTLVLNLATR